MPDEEIKSTLEEGTVDPKEAAALEKAIKSKEQAPRTSEQSGSFVDWKKVRDELGDPFNVERIPMRKLRQMRKDPMIAFALHYITTPLVRAQWHMEARDKDGPNAQVAAFMDAAWRMIHARYVFQHTLDLSFGFQAIVKRFQLKNPGGVYEDNSEADPANKIKSVWDEGTVLPIVWKAFVALQPERVEPKFSDKTGEFEGILYEIPPAERRQGLGFRAKSQKDNQNQRLIDVYHSLWATNDRDPQFGSIYGYARIAHAYRYWWSYWFRWAQYDRAFERLAVPPLVAYHPEGSYVDPLAPNDDPIQYSDIALTAAENLRANAIAAVPSTLAKSGVDEKGTTQREWQFEFLDVKHEQFQHFDKSFNYLDVLKLRSIWVPEQAFIEGEGGTSSRNVAAQMAEVFVESQANKWDDMADHINRFILPQLLVVNFPEFVNNGGSCSIIGHGFAKSDIELLKQLIQVIGQSDPKSMGVDIRESLRRLNIPLMDPADLEAEMAKTIAAAGKAGPPPVAPQSGPGAQVGTVPFAPGSTNGGSVPQPNGNGAAAGFADEEQIQIYTNPQETIMLSADADFLANLPSTKHYSDRGVKALAAQLRKIWAGHYRAIYPEFAQFVATQKIEMSDDDIPDNEAMFEFSEQRSMRVAQKAANRILKEWSQGSGRLQRLAASSSSVIKRMLKRAVKLEQKESGFDGEIDEDTYNAYLDNQIGILIRSTTDTVKDELKGFLVNQIREGKDAEEIGIAVQENFSEFPSWKANRIARSETRDAGNAATLMSGEAAGLKYVRAADGEDHDEDCRKRNGRLFTIREAWKEIRKEHPNGTLSFDLVARANFSIEMVGLMPEQAPAESLAFYDKDSETAYIHKGLATDSRVDDFLIALGENLVSRNGNVSDQVLS